MVVMWKFVFYYISRVVRWKVADVSDDNIAFIFRVDNEPLAPFAKFFVLISSLILKTEVTGSSKPTVDSDGYAALYPTELLNLTENSLFFSNRLNGYIDSASFINLTNSPLQTKMHLNEPNEGFSVNSLLNYEIAHLWIAMNAAILWPDSSLACHLSRYFTSYTSLCSPWEHWVRQLSMLLGSLSCCCITALLLCILLVGKRG
jgi:hypothetical protein